jgi:hypothetical protein
MFHSLFRFLNYAVGVGLKVILANLREAYFTTSALGAFHVPSSAASAGQ